MDFKAQLQSDLDIFLNSDEFAQVVTIDGKSVKALFDEDHELVSEDYENGSNANISTFIPAITVKSGDTAGVKNGDTVTVDGKTYQIVEKAEEGDIVVFYLGR